MDGGFEDPTINLHQEFITPVSTQPAAPQGSGGACVQGSLRAKRAPTPPHLLQPPCLACPQPPCPACPRPPQANINSLFAKYDVPPTFDLLSIGARAKRPQAKRLQAKWLRGAAAGAPAPAGGLLAGKPTAGGATRCCLARALSQPGLPPPSPLPPQTWTTTTCGCGRRCWRRGATAPASSSSRCGREHAGCASW